MKHGKLQAKDVSDEQILQFITECGYVLRSNLDQAFPQYPSKVLLAKCRSLIKRKLIDGCPCGCSGNFTIIKQKETVQ